MLDLLHSLTQRNGRGATTRSRNIFRDEHAEEHPFGVLGSMAAAWIGG
ncbi:MAG: hypothetical protein HKL85_07585 [Acidimicrobiaceae bacterium]|nr:hypothetical protein [Acidimicrobiaceae bacterium]